MSKGLGDRPKASGDEGEPASGDPFVLEESFPNLEDLFEPHVLPPITESSVCIALDASALLLPYKVNSASLVELGKVYKQLAKEKRLFIPARAAREFVKNRNAQLGDLVQSLKQRREALSKLPPILADLPEFKDAAAEMESAKKAFLKLEERVRGWRGDDPVSSLYAKIFKHTMFVDLDLSKGARKQLEEEKSRRYRHKVPPGYKDASKDDGGIGDFLIWRTLLLLGSKEKKDLVFVTGDQKPDWFNQASGQPAYPRYELIDEFRRASDGKVFGLMNLHQLLDEMDVSDEIVKDVRKAEDEVRSSAAAQVPSLSDSAFATTAPGIFSTAITPGSTLFKLGSDAPGLGSLFPGGTITTIAPSTAVSLPAGTILFSGGGNLSLSDQLKNVTKTSESGGSEKK